MPILNLTLTESGYQAMFSRYPHVRLKIVRVEYTEFTAPYTPSPTQSSLVGPTLYSSTKITRQLNARNDIIFKTVLPDDAPNATYHEVGLFVENQLGQTFLFAVGVLPSGYVKNSDFQLLFVCYLRAPVFSYSVEFEANTLADIPVVDTYKELPPPYRTGPNVWTVRYGRQCGPSLVCKLGDMNEWGIVNGSKVYTGPVSMKELQVGIPVDISKMDAAMFTVVRGTGYGQSRRINSMGIIDSGLQMQLDKTSIVSIWTGPGCC